MGADRFGKQLEDGIAERAASSRRGAVRSVVMGDRLEAETGPGGHPVEAPREEGPITGDPLRPRRPVAGKVLEGTERCDRVVPPGRHVLDPALETDFLSGR